MLMSWTRRGGFALLLALLLVCVILAWQLASGARCDARKVAPRLRLRAEESTQRRAQDNLRQILSGLLLVKIW